MQRETYLSNRRRDKTTERSYVKYIGVIPYTGCSNNFNSFNCSTLLACVIITFTFHPYFLRSFLGREITLPTIKSCHHHGQNLKLQFIWRYYHLGDSLNDFLALSACMLHFIMVSRQNQLLKLHLAIILLEVTVLPICIEFRIERKVVLHI